MAIQVSGSTVIHDSQDVQVSGMFTASSFVGDASQLTNLPASGGTLEATASGTLADGSKVIINADGTVSAVGFSTVPKNWITTMGSSSSNEAWDVRVDSSGNVYIAGSDSQPYSGGGVAKLNSSSEIQWSRYSHAGAWASQVLFYAVHVDDSGNVYVGGKTEPSHDAILFKYNSSGVLQWKKELGTTSSYEYINGLAMDSSGNIYAASYMESKPAVIKLNSSGNTIWQRKYDKNGQPAGVAIDSSDNVYLVGNTSQAGQGGDDILLIKYNSSGTSQWERTLGSSISQRGYDLAVDSSDNIFVVGRTHSGTIYSGDEDVVLAKYDSSGNLLWQRQLGGSGMDSYYDGIAIDNSDNVYLSIMNTGQTLTAVKYDNDGNIQWQNSLNTTGTEYNKNMAVDPDGSNIYIVGHCDVSGASTEWVVAKLPGDGTGTGTYGTFTYSASSLTDQAGTMTGASYSHGSTNFTLSNNTSTLNEGDANMTTSAVNAVSYATNLTGENFIGVSNGAYSNGQTATIQVTGSVDDAQSGLTAGQAYYVQDNGTLGESGSVFAGTAVSASKIIVKG